MQASHTQGCIAGALDSPARRRANTDPNPNPNPNPNQVLSTNLQGGEAYELSPRMHEYCVALVSSLAPQVRAALRWRVRGAIACAWRVRWCVHGSCMPCMPCMP
eukprot:scaffold101878_cov63-Phaeocystis_antarctica.AAC.3